MGSVIAQVHSRLVASTTPQPSEYGPDKGRGRWVDGFFSWSFGLLLCCLGSSFRDYAFVAHYTTVLKMKCSRPENVIPVHQ